MKPKLTKKIIASMLSLVLVTSVVFSHYGFDAAGALGEAILVETEPVEPAVEERGTGGDYAEDTATESNAADEEESAKSEPPNEDGSSSGNQVASSSNAVQRPTEKNWQNLYAEDLEAYLNESEEAALQGILKRLTEEQWASLFEVMGEAAFFMWWEMANPLEIATPSTASYITPAPLLPPVAGSKQMLKRAGDLDVLSGNQETEKLNITKNAFYDEESGQYKIRLESYATGEVISQTSVIPTDIVLVLDQSGSMDETFTESSYRYTVVEYASEIVTDRTYYIKINNNYTDVSYSRLGGGWYYGSFLDRTYVNPIDAAATQSGDDYHFYTRTAVASKTKLDTLKEAVTTFVTNVSQNAFENQVDHRIAVVGFASTGSGYRNTELLSTAGAITYHPEYRGSYTASNIKSALVAANSEGRLNDRIITAIDRLAADGDTYSEYGFAMADDIFRQNPLESGEQRNRVVIMFTDGYTAPRGTNNIDYSMSDRAIENAQKLKGGGSTVYTIGIFEGADPEADMESNFDYGSTNAARQLVAANRYMHYSSGNYPDARNMRDGGTKAKDGYYLTAGNEDDLIAIFENISHEIETPGIDLEEEAVLRDVLSSYFALPENTATDDISVYTADCIGKQGDNLVFQEDMDWAPLENALIHIEGKQIEVSGFNYKENFAAVDEGGIGRGQKLIVEFPVVPEAGFIGGNAVHTNSSAGIYVNSAADQPLKTVATPEVNVAIRFDFATKNEEIYIGDDFDLTQFFDNNKFSVDGTEYSLDGCRNAYVNIEYQIYEEADLIATYTVNAGESTGTWSAKSAAALQDKSYAVTAVVTPIKEGNGLVGVQSSMSGITCGPKSSEVYVYTPVITTQDLGVYLTDTPELKDAIALVEWKHGDIPADEALMGPVPELALTFDWTGQSYPLEDTGISIETVVRPDIDFSLKDAAYNFVEIQGTGATDDFTVYVFKPEVPCTDEVIFYGESTDLNDRIHKSNVIWSNKKANEAQVTPEGAAPELSYGFSWVSGTPLAIGQDISAYEPSQDSTFTFTVWAQGDDVTAHTQKTNQGVSTNGLPQDFTIYVVKGQLDITKNIDKRYSRLEALYASQSFVFKIDRRDAAGGPVTDTFYEVITFQAGQGQTSITQTIRGLKKGYYTVTEDMDWAWRYQEAGRQDNYQGNSIENEDIFIGDRLDTEATPYFGVQEGTVVDGKDLANQACADFTDHRRDIGWLGDAANAVNRIVRKPENEAE